MSCIVYQTNKKTGTRYAYRSVSYRDPVTGTPKSKRTYLGRVDPVTGEIIPKGTAGTHNTTPLGVPGPDGPVDLARELRAAREEARRYAKRVAELEAEVKSLRAFVDGIGELVQQANSMIEAVSD